MTDYDAVLLDLDGTLCEYVRGTEELLPAAFESVGVDPLFTPAEYHERVDLYADRADSMLERRELCFADLAAENGYDPEVGLQVAAAYADARDHSNVRFLDGAREALTDLAERYPLALVTNGGPTMQDQKIDGLGVREHFETVVYAGHDVPAKPDPEPFEAALDALGIRPDQTVYVGNNYEADVVGAAAADVPSVLVGEAPTDGSVEPLAAVDSPREVTDLL
jgi:putative hydrolase of the HAD superfamily